MLSTKTINNVGFGGGGDVRRDGRLQGSDLVVEGSHSRPSFVFDFVDDFRVVGASCVEFDGEVVGSFGQEGLKLGDDVFTTGEEVALEKGDYTWEKRATSYLEEAKEDVACDVFQHLGKNFGLVAK